jgi:hypothetical protein
MQPVNRIIIIIIIIDIIDIFSIINFSIVVVDLLLIVQTL